MEQNKIKFVSKNVVAAVTDINYGISWRHTLCMSFWNHLCFGKFDKGGRGGSNGLDSALS